MTEKQKLAIKRDLPHNWRIRARQMYLAAGKAVELQHFTDMVNGKIRNPEAVREFLLIVKQIKKEYQAEKQEIAALI